MLLGRARSLELRLVHVGAVGGVAAAHNFLSDEIARYDGVGANADTVTILLEIERARHTKSLLNVVDRDGGENGD